MYINSTNRVRTSNYKNTFKMFLSFIYDCCRLYSTVTVMIVLTCVFIFPVNEQIYLYCILTVAEISNGDDYKNTVLIYNCTSVTEKGSNRCRSGNCFTHLSSLSKSGATLTAAQQGRPQLSLRFRCVSSG